MKIRNGFVSNSSSSSFIIAYKEHVCPCCKRSNIRVIEHILQKCQDGDYNYQLRGQDKESIINEILSRYSWTSTDNSRRYCEKLIETINNISENMKLIYCQVSNNDDAIISELNTLNDGENGIILDESG